MSWPDWVGWVGILGTVGTFSFGGLAVWQWLRDMKRGAAREAHESHLYATIEQLGIVRAFFAEALGRGEAFKTDADKVAVRAVAHDLVAAENHIRTALGLRREEPQPLPGSRRDPSLLPPSRE